MTAVTKERLAELAAAHVALVISELASDREALTGIIDDNVDTADMTAEEVQALRGRLETAIRRHLPAP